MERVMIVDDDESILKRMLATLIQYKDEFEVITANSGEAAIKVLKETHIDLLITDLVMPETDGLTLLAYINEHYPQVLCIAMTGYATDNMVNLLPDNLLQLIPKPFKLNALADIIRNSLKKKSPTGTVHGISIPSFLQLIELEGKSCVLDITLADNKKGTCLFKEGGLYDASFKDLTGEEAALEIIRAGGKAIFTLLPLPRQDIPRQIKSGITGLLLKASHP